MIRLVEIVIVAATIIVAICLYAFKYDTGHVAREIVQLKQQIEEENKAIGILKAEWSLLNQPERVQKLAEQHLTLEPLKADQIKNFADLPEKPPQEALTDLVRRALSSPTESLPSVR